MAKQSCLTIISFYDEQQLSLAQEVKASLGPSLALREQRLIEPPTPAERRDHELTHQPYQEWCPAYISARARPDAHMVDVEEGWKEKLIVLHGHDAHSGAVFSLPLQRKGDIKCLARELSRFAMSFGIGYIVTTNLQCFKSLH